MKRKAQAQSRPAGARPATLAGRQPANRARTTITVRRELLEGAKELVDAGEIESTSALVERALERELRQGDLEALLDELDQIYGKPPREAQTWAKRVIASLRSS